MSTRSWFWSARCAGRDYLYDSHWHTHPGRMAVYCPHDPKWPSYHISKSELPPDLPEATHFFIRGFLAGNLPGRPSEEEDPWSPTMSEWSRAAERFSADGVWHVEADLDAPWRQIQRQVQADAATSPTSVGPWRTRFEPSSPCLQPWRTRP